VDVGNFNTFSGIPFGPTSLLLAGGSSSGATLATTLTSGYIGLTPASTSTPDGRMMSEYISWNSAVGISPNDRGFITVSNLPDTFTSVGYDLIVYSDADVTYGRTFTISITNCDNGTSVSASVADNGTFSGAYILGTNGNTGNYTRFAGLTATNFILQAASTSGRAAVNGFQIIAGGLLPQLAINSFEPVPRHLAPGGSTRLNWSVAGATGISISPGIGNVTALTTNGAGSITVSPAGTTAYILTATNSLGTLLASNSVVVGPPIPNIVMFLVDDMGWEDTSVPFFSTNTLLNARYDTPNMERLAAQGVKFTSAYACPVCTPSRVSLNTGFNAAHHKVTNWTATTVNTDTSGTTATLRSPSGWCLNGLQPSGSGYNRVFTDDNTLARLLHAAGYRTIHVGKAHFAPAPTPGSNPLNLGFDINIAGSEIGNPASYYGSDDFGSGPNHVPGLDEYYSSVIGTNIFLTEALTLQAQIQVAQAVADQQPFYLYMAQYAVHQPIQLDARFGANFASLDPTEQAYNTMIEGMDQSLGDLLDELDQLGVAQNTVVCFYSDNGGMIASGRGTSPYGSMSTLNYPLRAGKGSCYEGGIREPAIFAWASPNPTNAFQQALPILTNSVCNSPIIIEDLFPTILDWAGVTPPTNIDGLDITGYVTARPGFSRPSKFLWHFPNVWDASLLGQNAGYEPFSIWRDGDWKAIYFYNENRWELYNLASDIGETNNLAVNPTPANAVRLMAMAGAIAGQLDTYGAAYPELLSNGMPVPPMLPYLPFAVQPSRSTGGQPQMSWPSMTNAVFQIQATATLQPPNWNVVADNVPGQSGTTTWPLPLTNSVSQFYRVMLK